MFNYNIFTVCSVDCIQTVWLVFFFQAEDGIRDLVRSRGLGDVYKRQVQNQGPSDAQNVVVTDTLPVSTTYAGSDAACVELSLIHI